jgi:hypothetical protein
MRKLITAATLIVALAVPTIAAAAPGPTGVSTNGNTKDAVGFCVSAGNYNYHQIGTTTGADRSALNAADPGSVSALIHTAQDQTTQVGNFCANGQSAYAPPGQ